MLYFPVECQIHKLCCGELCGSRSLVTWKRNTFHFVNDQRTNKFSTNDISCYLLEHSLPRHVISEVFKQNMKLVKSYNFIVAFPRPAVQETRHNSVIIICPKDWSHVILMNSLNSYRPQRSWGKVMFLQASVILLTGGVCYPSMHGR